MELAALIDAGVHFIKATYYLEGDGPLIFTCYEKLSAVSWAVAVDNCPNTLAVDRESAGGNAALCNQLIARAKACIQPVLQFYQQSLVASFMELCERSKLHVFAATVQVQN